MRTITTINMANPTTNPTTLNFSTAQLNIFKLAESQPQQSIIINAVAGSGKTTTIVELAKRLTHSGDRALFLAFNAHVKDHLQAKFSNAGSSNVSCQTFHGLGLKVVGTYLMQNLRVDKYKYSNLCANKLKTSTYKRLVDNMDKLHTYSKVLENLQSIIDYVQQDLLDFSSPYELMQSKKIRNLILGVKEEMYLRCAIEILNEGVRMAQDQGIISFSDMIWLIEIFNCEIKSPRRVFIDECQDLNLAEIGMIARMRKNNTTFYAVGDPYQAIMGFAGAACNSFEQVQQAIDGVVMPLDVCYRCAKSHIKLAQTVVPHIKWSDNAIEGVLAEKSFSRMLESEGHLFTQTAMSKLVVARKTVTVVCACFSLIAKGVPAKVKGRDIGSGLVNVINELEKECFITRDNFVTLLNGWYSEICAKISTIPEQGKRNGKLQVIDDKYECLLTIWNNSRCFNAQDLKNKIQDLFSDDKDNNSNNHNNKVVTLSTVHRAKGLEADIVFVLDPSSLPLVWNGQTKEEYQQELNLQYVAYTRAKQQMYLCQHDGNSSY